MKIKGMIILLGIVALGGQACKSTHELYTTPAASISSEKFLKSPFGHDESIASFSKTLPTQTATKKLVRRNKHYPEKSDTIYQFKYKESEIFVYKSYFNKEILMAGTVANPQIELANGLKTGITREQLYKTVSGIKQSEADTLKLSTPENDRIFSFIFKKGKLKKITFASYYD